MFEIDGTEIAKEGLKKCLCWFASDFNKAVGYKAMEQDNPDINDTLATSYDQK